MLISNLDNYIKFVAVTCDEIYLQANYDGIFYNSIPSYNGYTPYVIIPSNSNAPDVCWMAAYVHTFTEICLRLKNTATVEHRFSPVVDVLYVRNL